MIGHKGHSECQLRWSSDYSLECYTEGKGELLFGHFAFSGNINEVHFGKESYQIKGVLKLQMINENSLGHTLTTSIKLIYPKLKIIRIGNQYMKYYFP